MGVFTFESEATSVIPPAKVFKAFVLESDTHIPKVIPRAIQSIEIVEGDGGPGSIKKISFGQGSQFSYVKHKIESLDSEKLTYCYRIIEGDVIGESMEKVENEIKVLASADGGSVVKSTNKYYTKGDYEVKEEEQIEAGKEKGLGLFQSHREVCFGMEHPDYN